MYGIVNKAIQDLVVAKFGQQIWENVLTRSAVDEDFFISSEPYDDDITFRLAEAISQEMTIPLSSVFIEFGVWWVTKTTKEKYGGMLEAGGTTLQEFLENLPSFHNRVMLIYPKLTPPEFKISNVKERSLHLHYFSKREGLQDFVRGLIIGLGNMFRTTVIIKIVQSKICGSDHDVFKITW